MKNTDNQKDRDKRLEELRSLLTGKQLKFAEEYLIDLNATQAAIRAKYSQKTAYSIGFENLRKPEIKEYISLRLDDYGLTESELLKMMSSIAKSSLNDYIVVRKIERVRSVEKPLKLKIEDLLLKIKKNCMYMERASLTEDQIESITNQNDHYQNEIIKLQIDLEINPDATFEVAESYETEVADLDLIALARDKENGKIKGISFGQFGPKVEMSDPDAMIKTLAQIKGMITNKIDAEVNATNKNIEVTVSPEEAKVIAKSILGDI